MKLNESKRRLEILHDYIRDNIPAEKIDMDGYIVSDEDYSGVNVLQRDLLAKIANPENCGTAACFLGHSMNMPESVKMKDFIEGKHIDWYEISREQFGFSPLFHQSIWDFVFSSTHSGSTKDQLLNRLRLLILIMGEKTSFTEVEVVTYRLMTIKNVDIGYILSDANHSTVEDYLKYLGDRRFE